ncbi:hypothetical protein G6F65_018831 [Rhizopus arrhizus]|nr:hypothetical protein G6F65_018831 [Rhizopus arrhizus]
MRGHRGHHRLVGAQQLVRHQAGHHSGHGDVQHGADRQRQHHADRHVALRVLRFLRRHRHRLEADVGEEHHRRAAQHAFHAVLAGAFVGGNERGPVAGVDVLPADPDDQHDQAGLEHDHRHVHRRGLADADVAQPGQQQYQRGGRQVGDRAGRAQLRVEWRADQRRR